MTGKPEHLPDNLILVIGQILEATTSASEGLKLVSAEVQKNAQAVITAANTIDIVEQRVEELDAIIRETSNDNNLVRKVQEHANQITSLQAASKSLRAAVGTLRKDLEKIQKRDDSETASRKTIKDVIKLLAWMIGTFLAAWAAWAAK